MAQALNPSTWGVDAGRSLILNPDGSTELVPVLAPKQYRETLLLKTRKKNKKGKKTETFLFL